MKLAPKGNLAVSQTFAKLRPTLQQGLSQLGMSLAEVQQTQLLYYLQQLLFWNKAYNLTAIKVPDEALVKHIFDSLSLIVYLPVTREPMSLLDIGTGAGLPAAVIAICRPDITVTALDSNGKKIRFIKQIASELMLDNLVPVAERIEAYQGCHGLITSRAFASLGDFVSLGAPYLATDGQLIAMKGVVPNDEIALLTPTWQVKVIELSVPMLAESRHLVILSK